MARHRNFSNPVWSDLVAVAFRSLSRLFAVFAVVDLGSKLVTVVGFVCTVTALLGKPVPGLWQLIERRGENGI